MIVLNEPIVRVDGARIPYFSAGNSFFDRLKANLRDGNIYDTSEAAVPFTDRMVTLTGTATTGVAYRAYNEQQGQKRLVGSVQTNATGGFEFSVRLRNGKNKLFVESADLTDVSNAVFLNAYRLHAWLSTYAAELELARDELARTRQDSKLRSGTDFEGTLIDNTGKGLTESFGQFVSPLIRLPGLTVPDWRQALRDVFQAYRVAPSVDAMSLVTRFFTDVDPEYSFYYLENRLRRPRFTDGQNDFLVSAANPGVDRAVTWHERRFYLYNRWWRGEVSGASLPASDVTHIYYDGTTAATGLGSPDPVTFLARPILAAAAPVVTGTRTILETVLSGDVIHDADGSKTGLSGELCARASFYVSRLNGVSGSNVPFTAGIGEATLVTGSAFIDLGHAQLGQDKRPVLGDLSLSYETPLEVFEVARVATSATTITGIQTGQRLDEVSGVVRETQVAQHAGEVLVHNSGNLASGVRTLLTGVLFDVKPPETLWYVFMNDPTTNDMVFYSKV